MKIIKNKKMISSIVVIIVIITGLLMEIIMKEKKYEGLNESIVATTALTTQVATITSIIEVTEVTTEQVTEKPIEKQIETTTVQVVETVSPTTKAEPTKVAKLKEAELKEENISLYSASEFMNTGVIHWNGWKWTWYSEKVLAGEGLNIPNRYTDSNGYVCDSDGYICLASSVLSKGTVIPTPFGKDGKVYDSGCASDVVDVYVGW